MSEISCLSDVTKESIEDVLQKHTGDDALKVVKLGEPKVANELQRLAIARQML